MEFILLFDYLKVLFGTNMELRVLDIFHLNALMKIKLFLLKLKKPVCCLRAAHMRVACVAAQSSIRKLKQGINV